MLYVFNIVIMLIGWYSSGIMLIGWYSNSNSFEQLPGNGPRSKEDAEVHSDEALDAFMTKYGHGIQAGAVGAKL